MDWLTTSTLLADLRNERGEAWQCLVERFRGPIVRFARRVGHSPADAEDVAQQTLLTFMERYREGRYDRDRGRLSHWLFGIAWNQLLRDRRARARGPVNVSTPATDTSFVWSRRCRKAAPCSMRWRRSSPRCRKPRRRRWRSWKT